MLWLAYLHPSAMVAVLVLAVLVLRAGLRIRRGRLARQRVDSRWHRRWARVLLVGVVLGFGFGLFSMAVLRGKELAQSVHFPLAAGALLAMVSAGGLGLLLERGGSLRTRTVHALCGALFVLLALGAAVAGFALLP